MKKQTKLRYVDETKDTGKTRAPPKRGKAQQAVKVKKLKLEADKAKERSEQLRFGKAEVTVDEASRMTKAQKAAMFASMAALTPAHRAVEEHEDENVGVKSAHEVEKGAETGGRLAKSRYAKKLKKKAEAQKNAKSQNKGQTESATSFEKAKVQKEQEGGSNPLSRWTQRKNIRKGYAAAAKAGTSASGAASGQTASGGAAAAKSGFGGIVNAGKSAVSSMTNSAAVAAKQNAHLLVMLGALLLVILLMMSAFSSCAVLFGGSTQVSGQTFYSAEDEDILGAEEDYKKLEKELQRKIDRIPATNPDYDEYQYHLDEIGHDPYELASYLTTLFDDYTQSEVQAKLKETFEKQYKLTLTPEIQIRYRVVVVPLPVPPYVTTTVEPYTYKILHVTLENKGLETVIREELDTDQEKRYDILQDTKGGRPYLFGDTVSFGSTTDGSGEAGIDYQVPAEALTDPEFAAMLEEAEKYLGTPYVWGGSSPETGFDCSGYVSWVLNQSGWDVGRQNANGLWNMSTKISESEAKPGDLVFFEGTYDTAGASHVGLYVGNGMMISAGDPIKYSNIHSSYWDKHLLGFGRIPK